MLTGFDWVDGSIIGAQFRRTISAKVDVPMDILFCCSVTFEFYLVRGFSKI